jgi:tyrosyl-tRNA synthetase
MSPYAFYQFWLNVEDEKVEELLKVFTFVPRAELEALVAEHADKPFLRTAQRTLAQHVTTLVHGEEVTRQVERASEALFGGGELAEANVDYLAEALATARPLVELETGDSGRTVVQLLVESGLVQSNGEARRAVNEGGAYVNNERVDDPDHVPAASDFLGGRLLVLRRGKKNFAGVRVRA